MFKDAGKEIEEGRINGNSKDLTEIDNFITKIIKIVGNKKVELSKKILNKLKRILNIYNLTDLAYIPPEFTHIYKTFDSIIKHNYDTKVYFYYYYYLYLNFRFNLGLFIPLISFSI
jgi:hypothetical protein